jgi:hypothetical protein
MRRAWAGLAAGILFVLAGCGDNHPAARIGAQDASPIDHATGGSPTGGGGVFGGAADAQPAGDAAVPDDAGPAAVDVGAPAPSDAVVPASDSDPGTPGVTSILGAVQKGPFRVGAKVQVTMLDGQGQPTGAPIVTTISNDLGEFSLDVPTPGPVEIVATGVYYQQPSYHFRPISLRAIVQARGHGPQRVFVNTMTHLIAGRALKLFRNGLVLAEALAQAQSELQKTLGQFVPGPLLRPAASIDLFGEDDDSSAYLSVLEATFAGDADADRWLDMVVTGFEPDGIVDAETTRLFPGVRDGIDVPLRAERLRAFARSLGREAVIPDLERGLDFDGDGIADRSDPDADGDGIPGAQQKFVAVVAPGSDGLALRSDGTVWSLDRRRVVPLVGIKTLIAPESGSMSHWTLALQNEGTLWQLGGGAPAKVSGLTGVKSIFPADAVSGSGNPAKALILKDDDTVWLASADGAAPVQFVALTGAVALAASNNAKEPHVLAVKADGSVSFAMPSQRDAATIIPGVTAINVFAGPHSGPGTGSECAVKPDKTVWCWTYEGVAGRTPGAPVEVPALAGAVSFDSSSWVTVVKTDGSVWRWDLNRPPGPVAGCAAAVNADRSYPVLVATVTGALVRCDYHWSPRMIGIPDTGFMLPFRMPR